MYSLLLLSSLVHITTCTVYTVTPDDHYYPNTTCHHCHNLQHYLLNITKYFTSNTQLLFLPGLHHRHTDLIIQNVHNISLIGSTANGTTLDTVIQCDMSFIFFFNISKLTVMNIGITINNCQIQHSYFQKCVPLYVKDCSFVSLSHLQVHKENIDYYVVLHIIEITNIIGNSNLSHVNYYGEIKLIFAETYTDTQYNYLLMDNCTVKVLTLEMLQKSYKVMLKVLNMKLQHAMIPDDKPFIYVKELGANEVDIFNCQFVSNTYVRHIFVFNSKSNGTMQFTDCQFINNNVIYFMTKPYIVNVNIPRPVQAVLIEINGSVNIEFNSCNFNNNNENQILLTHGREANPNSVVVRNTGITTSMSGIPSEYRSYFSLSHTTLILVDSVNFYNIITAFSSIISFKGNSTMVIFGTVKFLHNHVHVLLDFLHNDIQYITIKHHSILNISQNIVWSVFDTKLPTTKYPYPTCFFIFHKFNN